MKQATIDRAMNAALEIRFQMMQGPRELVDLAELSDLAACLRDLADPMGCKCVRVQQAAPVYCPKCVLTMLANALEGKC